MAYNYPANFWDYVRSFEGNNNGEGVDRPAQPYGGWPFGDAAGDHPHHPPPPPHGPHHGSPGPHHGGPGPHHGPGQHHPPPPPPPFPFGAGFPFGRGFHGGPRGHHGGPHHRGGRRGHCGRRGERSGGEDNEHNQGGPGGAFDFSALLAQLGNHPLAQQWRQFMAQATAQAQQSGEVAREADNEEENGFTPPIDIFTTESHYVLHVALPGAKKEDVGINWDAEKGVLNVAGVIYRQGDEEFLKGLTQSERKVGVFERAVKLPPGGNEEKEEVDSDGITAKLEDGVLIVRVPKLEKEWLDVKKVAIE